MIDITYTTTLRANKLIQNICETLHNNHSFHHEQDQQWEIICQELFHSNENDQYIRRRRNIINEEDSPPNQLLHKAAIRGGGGFRGGGVIRGGGNIRGGGVIRGGGGGGSSIARYRNTRTGTTIPRPNGWQWSRSGLIFLPISTLFFYRSRSSSNRFTTPATSSLTYYYCTQDSDPSTEIQCSSVNRDSLCCEDEKTKEVFCCGGDIPDDIVQDMNRATKTIARIFYTLAVLTFCIHLFMRRFY